MVCLILVAVLTCSLVLYSTKAAPFQFDLASLPTGGKGSDAAQTGDGTGIQHRLSVSTIEVPAATTWYFGNMYSMNTATCVSSALRTIVTKDAFTAMVSVAIDIDTRAPLGDANLFCVAGITAMNNPPYPSAYFNNEDDPESTFAQCYYPTTATPANLLGNSDLADYQRFCPCESSASPTIAPTKQPTFSVPPSLQPTAAPSTLPPSNNPTREPQCCAQCETLTGSVQWSDCNFNCFAQRSTQCWTLCGSLR